MAAEDAQFQDGDEEALSDGINAAEEAAPEQPVPSNPPQGASTLLLVS